MNKKDTELLDEVYAHISNGGVKFSIIDEGYGPTFLIESSHFGNNVSSQKIMLNKQTFQKVADMFSGLRDHQFSKDYCCAARDFI